MCPVSPDELLVTSFVLVKCCGQVINSPLKCKETQVAERIQQRTDNALILVRKISHLSPPSPSSSLHSFLPKTLEVSKNRRIYMLEKRRMHKNHALASTVLPVSHALCKGQSFLSVTDKLSVTGNRRWFQNRWKHG